jgi:hypothetical protein
MVPEKTILNIFKSFAGLYRRLGKKRANKLFYNYTVIPELDFYSLR